MPKTLEYKDTKGKHRITHTADNGNVTYASSQGYHNLTDLRESTINTAIELLEHYDLKKRITPEQSERIINLADNIRFEK